MLQYVIKHVERVTRKLSNGYLDKDTEHNIIDY
jgi:hypothetical protein